MQNELLEAMTLGMMRQISANIQNATLKTKTTEIQTIEDPKLPRKGKAPVRPKFGEQDTHTFLKLPKTITDESTLMR